jgi:hypothetical protein
MSKAQGGRAGTVTGAGKRYSRQARRQGRSRTLWLLAGGLAVILVGAGLWYAAQGRAAGEPGQAVPIQSRDHIAEGATHPPYNSDPPTGGWHYATPAAPGVYDKQLLDEQVVHNLEHGYIVIAYDCSRLSNCDSVKAELKSTFDRNRGWKMVVEPRKNADAAIALTAWGRIEKLDSLDAGKIQQFINAYRDKGPEQTAE